MNRSNMAPLYFIGQPSLNPNAASACSQLFIRKMEVFFGCGKKEQKQRNIGPPIAKLKMALCYVGLPQSLRI